MGVAGAVVGVAGAGVGANTISYAESWFLPPHLLYSIRVGGHSAGRRLGVVWSEMPWFAAYNSALKTRLSFLHGGVSMSGRAQVSSPVGQ